jgi:rhodanese-related sulfurtransferase
MKKTLTALALAVVAVLGLAGCAGSPAVAPSVTVTSSMVVVDVRTAAEYAGGHLENAVNVDIQSPDFDTLVAELPVDGDYLVYCASGNRSAAAVARMTELGFTSLVDAGGITDAAAATGLEIVADK